MILTDYYKLERLPEFASNRVPRFDCTSSSKSYEWFEAMGKKSKVNRFFCYYTGIPDPFSERAKSQAEMVITHGKDNISSVFVPQLQRAHLGYGDIKNTRDAVLFVFSKDYSSMEMFIARGYKFQQLALFGQMVTGGLQNEMKYLRDTAR